MDEMGKLKVGVNVDIQRTDGRIHSAVISGTNPESKSVTVEWFEKGETKGKEIEIEAIFLLNPDLVSAPAPTGRESKSSKGSKPDGDGPTNRQLNVVKKAAAPSSAKSRLSYQAQQQPVSNGHPVNKQQPDTDPKGAAARRKSNCVKAVEGIQKKRDERRANQEAARLKNERDYDMSDPNWEFLAMIKEYRAGLDFRPLTSSDPTVNHQICVCVRKRPLNKKELSKKDIDVLTLPNKENVLVHEPKTKVDLTKFLENQTFRFDYAFDENATNDMVYSFLVRAYW